MCIYQSSIKNDKILLKLVKIPLEPELPLSKPQLSSKCESLVLQDITKNTQRRETNAGNKEKL